MTDNATLAFDRSDTISVSNVISGSGAVAQSGIGTTILTGGQQLRRLDGRQRRRAGVGASARSPVISGGGANISGRQDRLRLRHRLRSGNDHPGAAGGEL